MKVIQGKVPLFFIGLAMFKTSFFCQTSSFRDPLASGPLLGFSLREMGTKAENWKAGGVVVRRLDGNGDGK